MTPAEHSFFEDFCSPLIGRKVEHQWQGYGSAIFIEIGTLIEGRRRRDGSLGNPRGEWTLMAEAGWRIEGKRRILCGSGSEVARWSRFLRMLVGQRVRQVSTSGRLPELDVEFDSGVHLVTFSAYQGDPDWGLIERLGGRSLGVRAGRLSLEANSSSVRLS